MQTEPNATPPNGRFQPGNVAAVGHSSRSQKLRHAMLQAVTETDIAAIVTKLVEAATDGDLKAMTLLFSVIGKPVDDKPPVTITSDIRTEIAMLYPRRENPTHADIEARREQIRAIADRVKERRKIEAVAADQ